MTSLITTQLPFRKVSRPPLEMRFAVEPVPGRQARFASRDVLKPQINLDDYRFRAVIDWIELVVVVGRGTQFQHVQKLIEPMVGRTPHVVPWRPGTGGVTARFQIRVQEPSIAGLQQVSDKLRDTYGLAEHPTITGIEVSVDAYARNATAQARQLLLGVLQRTLYTDRDVWTNPDSRPRFNYGPGTTSFITPRPGTEKKTTSPLRPEHYLAPALDGTMYVGARGEDLMVRLMDKVMDRQNQDAGTREDLPEDEKRVRVEVTLKGDELDRLKLRTLEELAGFPFTTLQGEIFQFFLPTFLRVPRGSGRTSILTQQWTEAARRAIFLEAGILGMIAHERERQAERQRHLPNLMMFLEFLDRTMPRRRTGTGETAHFLAYADLNTKVSDALRGLQRREARALP
ncbi:hypothetical protein H5395_16270 [Paracoccus sp. MC1854]|uniref:hypothetical protein n=1 Tax=Paracoccus sp. MC1854 TaxID=2760306 RepID=UPI00160049E2|nr:hypothetical protein [Paracoccus sp. MC1854]MBB1493032.1 hypothetical protein [Paracoccus sp. MC1854]